MKSILKSTRANAVLLSALLALAGSAAFAVARDAVTGAQSTTFYACVTKEYKTLNLTTRSKRCPKGQKKISWNAKGRDGARGPAGRTGAAGAPGLAGAPGAVGAAGPAGAPGAAGADGVAGRDGANGVRGATGPAGEPGPRGATGPAGADGVDGADGERGPSGFVDVVTFNGWVPSIAGDMDTWVFAGPTSTLTISAGTRLIGAATLALGLSVTNTSTDIGVDLCYRAVGGTATTNFSLHNFIDGRLSGQRTPISATGSAEPGAGTWEVGACVWNFSELALDANDYMNGWVAAVKSS